MLSILRKISDENEKNYAITSFKSKDEFESTFSAEGVWVREREQTEGFLFGFGQEISRVKEFDDISLINIEFYKGYSWNPI